jgi:hypothetical protein
MFHLGNHHFVLMETWFLSGFVPNGNWSLTNAHYIVVISIQEKVYHFVSNVCAYWTSWCLLWHLKTWLTLKNLRWVKGIILFKQITYGPRVCLGLFLLHKKKSFKLWNRMGFAATLIIKVRGKFYLSCDLELLETHMLNNNFHLF